MAATSPSDVWAVGGTGPSAIFLHWGGKSWKKAPQAPMGNVYAAGVTAISPTDAWAVAVDDGSQPISFHWDGAIWQEVTMPPVGTDDILGSVSADSSTDVWAGGKYIGDQGLQPLVEHWDGTTWTQIPASGVAGAGNVFYGITAIAPDDVWGVGYSDSAALQLQPLIEHWDGLAWSVVASPTLPGNDNVLSDVSGTGPDDLWAVGRQGDTGSNTIQALVEHWDGVSWSVVSVPPLTGYVQLLGAAAVSSNDAWAVGQVEPDFLAAETLVMHWDGVSWSVVPTPTPGGIGALNAVVAVASGDVWAAGTYDNPALHQFSPLTMRSKGCA